MSSSPPILQLKRAAGVIQRLTTQELKELEAYYLREIREIGDPGARKNRAVYQAAQVDPTLDAAKLRIAQHIAAWKREVDRESRGVPDSGSTLLSPTSGMNPISHSDLTTVLGVHSTPTLPSLGKTPKERMHNPLTYKKLATYDLDQKLYAIAELAAEHGVTLFELQKRANTAMLQQCKVLDYIDYLATIVNKQPDFAAVIQSNDEVSLHGLVGVFYRYHKFTDDDDTGLVFGGGFNKSEISTSEPKIHGGKVAKHFKDRHEALETLSTGTPLEKTLALEAAQANAFSTPFIATTSDRRYTQQLFGEYPPAKGQAAVVLTILGPTINTLDFEKEFEALDRGFSLFNMRTVAKRSKDNAQAEYGIPDIFLPIGKRSAFGFVVAHVEWL